MKIAFATLGCKVNQYDTATIETAVRREGASVVPFGPGADVYVLNTCTVTDRADAESRRLARRARRWNERARVVVTGCFAQTQPGRAAGVPEVDHVIGVGRLRDVLRAIRGELDPESERVVVEDLRRASSVETLGAEIFGTQTRAFLKVQEGCDLFCTFCIVPFSRGKSRSVPPRQVLDEMERLAAQGYKEVVLTGIHLGSWGHDLDPPRTLADLVEAIAERSPVPRVRLSSIDPPEITPRLLALLKAGDPLCPHLHIPVQSGSTSVLRRMRRKYDAAFVRDILLRVADEVPDICIGTDVIAGFPGETEDEFEEGVALLHDLPFAYFHVFPYSRRAGTTAAKLPGQVPSRVIHQRAAELRRLGTRKRRAYLDRFVGRHVRVLVENTRDASGNLTGYARHYARVVVRNASDDQINGELAVRCTARHGERLLGEMTDRLPCY